MSALRFISFFIVAIVLCEFALFVQAGNAIEPLPSDISKKFTVDESGKQLTFVQSYLIPKKTGKFEITLPKTRSRVIYLPHSLGYIINSVYINLLFIRQQHFLVISLQM